MFLFFGFSLSLIKAFEGLELKFHESKVKCKPCFYVHASSRLYIRPSQWARHPQLKSNFEEVSQLL